jgi:carbamoyltransferase
MTRILGISAFFHDSAAALVVDGRIVAAAQEERFTRRKHDPAYPAHAIDYCLRSAQLTPEDLDYVGFYEKPLAKFDRLTQTYLAFAPAGIRSFRKALPLWLKTKLRLPRELDRGFDKRYAGSYVFASHHESHAASAFFPCPFEEAAILTLDGVGEWATGSFGCGRGNEIELSHEMRFPHSLGLLYSAFTYYTGFKVDSAEYKVMGLAPYGEPRFRAAILDELLDLKEDGSFRMDMSYFNYCQGLTMTSRKFDELFDGPPRTPESPITQREMDLAASVQAVTEEILLRCGRHVHEQTGMRHLALAGGVALNCVGVGRLLREGPFDDVWVQPASGDAGGALGVALLVWHQLLGKPREAQGQDAQSGSLLGPEFSDAEIRALLDSKGIAYELLADDEALCRRVAERLAAGEIVGWFQGRMEFGPRALGNRSILGDPRDPSMQASLNQKIKYRESFRPFAPAVLNECREEYFELDRPSPYMTLVAHVKQEQRREVAGGETARGLDRLKLLHSTLPATTHVDHSARLQTVDGESNPLLHGLLRAFRDLTGCPVLVNTSFNIRGEPIVCTPEDAYRCFLRTELDWLALGHCLLDKRAQRAMNLGVPEVLRRSWHELSTSSLASTGELVE